MTINHIIDHDTQIEIGGPSFRSNQRSRLKVSLRQDRQPSLSLALALSRTPATTTIDQEISLQRWEKRTSAIKSHTRKGYRTIATAIFCIA